MKSRTYYDILGVSRNATLEEITAAKNALAKVYHPDANMHKDIDTTAFMQEILEAYRILSDPQTRKEYNHDTFGETERVFKTFTLTEEKENDLYSFVTYWNAAYRLNEVVVESTAIRKKQKQEINLSQRIFSKLNGSHKKQETHRSLHMNALRRQASRCIAILRTSGIPSRYWTPEAMNWVLIRWGQRQSTDYLAIFSRYDKYLDESVSGSERSHMRTANRKFQQNLKKLLMYDSEV